ncbi:unnamed protein product [Rhodiola kirilowii]
MIPLLKRRILFFILVALKYYTTESSAKSAVPDEISRWENFTGHLRLPKFAVPKRYELWLKPDLVALNFAGEVKIDVDVVADTSFLVLNAADLNITTGSIHFSNIHEVLEPVRVGILPKDQVLVLEFERRLPFGLGVLEIGFKGILNDDLYGFYRSTYEVNGERKNMAVTQFESIGARKCFPCWDEPALKATFKITMEVPSELTCLSNMPANKEKVYGHSKTVYFQESPIMSTYLVAFVVGLFDYIEEYTTDGIKVRVYCPVGRSKEGTFALDVAIRTLDFYKEYFLVPYALPKLDMVSIHEFEGAMENYGLITFRDTALLYDSQSSGLSQKQDVADFVTHELGHQWCGDLVTMEWWKHLWLNEGFATWLSHLTMDSLFPSWKTWDLFLGEYALTLRKDVFRSSHPIEVGIDSLGGIDEIFDNIIYIKGASILRMLQTYLGGQVFQRSLAVYIKKYAWSNAKTEDLWDVFDMVSGRPVSHIMSMWTQHKGYPIVSIEASHQTLKFEQSQFLSAGHREDEEWSIPITFCCGSYNTCYDLLLDSRSKSLDIKDFAGCDCGKVIIGKNLGHIKSDNRDGIDTCPWIKVNVGQTGFYRVKYHETLVARLKYAAEKMYLSAPDRFGVLDDIYAFSTAQQLPLSSLLTFMSAYSGERDRTVLLNMITISYAAVNITADAAPEFLECTKEFLTTIIQNFAKRLGWLPKPGESDLETALRVKVLATLAVFGHSDTLKEARRRFHSFLNDRHTPLFPTAIRQAAYVAVMQTANTSSRKDYHSLMSLLNETTQSAEKLIILSSLLSSPDPEIVLEVLDFIVSSENKVMLPALSVSFGAREAAWTWLKGNWDYLLKMFSSKIATFVSKTVKLYASREKANEVKEFFANRTIPSIAMSLNRSIEQIQENAKWAESIQQDKKQLAEILWSCHSTSIKPRTCHPISS